MAGTFAHLLMSILPVAASADIRYRRPARGLITAVAKVDGDPHAIRNALNESGKVQFRVNVVLRDETQAEVAIMNVDWNVRPIKNTA